MNNNSDNTFTSFELDYAPSLSTALFAPVSSLPWAMLLHSASPQHPDSRFDILVAKPLATLETRGRFTTITRGNQRSQSADDPFQLLNHNIQQLLPAVETDEDTPFKGGALGYFSYDLGRRIEALPTIAQRDFDIADMAVGIYDWAVIIDHRKQRARVVGVNPQQQYQWLLAEAEKQPQTELGSFALTSSWQSNMSQTEYQDKFNRIQNYLLAGDCYQINLAQRFNASYQGDEWQAYQRLADKNQGPFSGFIRTPESTILSVSPERFLRLDGQQVETKPIKGTRPRSSDSVTDNYNAQQLRSAEKDQAENLMIVDLLRNDIGRVARPGSVKVPKLFDIESFPAVHHLVSTVTATLDEPHGAADLLRACFPGGSITGAPKVRAMEIIEELEPHVRSVYCGSIGYISRCGKMDSSITIRTLVAHNNKMFAWAGGGIVADSQCAAEYQETLDKLSKILPALSQ